MSLVAAPVQVATEVFELGLLLLLAVAAGWLARRLGLQAVVGYLAVGLLVSPFTPGYVADRGELSLFADVGVALLLFEVGIEIDVRRLGTPRAMLWAPPAQVAITTLLAGGAAFATGLELGGAAMIGLAVALSSSVMAVNVARDAASGLDPPTSDAIVRWGVTQDTVGVTVGLLLLAALGLSDRPPGPAAAAIAVFIALAVASATALPYVLRWLRGQQDLFLLVTLGTALALAGAGGRWFGLPEALAAFIAGLAVGESPVAAEARRRLLPFREVFAVLFFVLLGSLIDPTQVPAAVPWIGFLLVALAAAKLLPVAVLGRLAGLEGVRILPLALGLAQLGEFSFVLATIALGAGKVPPALFNAVIATVVISIVLSTVSVRLTRRTARPGR